jgi:hypothetical protein
MLDHALEWLIAGAAIGLMLLIAWLLDRRAERRTMKKLIRTGESPAEPPPLGAKAWPSVSPVTHPPVSPASKLSAPNDGPRPAAAPLAAPAARPAAAMPAPPAALRPTLPAASAPERPAMPARRPEGIGAAADPPRHGASVAAAAAAAIRPAPPAASPALPARPAVAYAAAKAFIGEKSSDDGIHAALGGGRRQKLPTARRDPTARVPRISEGLRRKRISDRLDEVLDPTSTDDGTEYSSMGSSPSTDTVEELRAMALYDIERQFKLDLVQASVFAPPLAPVDMQFLIQVWLHTPEDIAAAVAGAKDADSEAVKGATRSLQAEIARGARVDVEITCKELTIDKADRVKSIVWRGAPEACDFVVRAPVRMAGKTIFPTFTVEADGMPAGSVQCKLVCAAAPQVAQRAATRSPTPPPMTTLVEMPGGQDLAPAETNSRIYARAFISYQHDDLAAATLIVSGLTAGNPDLEFFIDVDTMRAGENWRERICDHIRACDLFVLVWSGRAKASSEVENEWQYALLQQTMGADGGPDFYPVTIEGPPIPLPPAELAHLNFRDRFGYIRAAAEAGKSNAR